MNRKLLMQSMLLGIIVMTFVRAENKICGTEETPAERLSWDYEEEWDFKDPEDCSKISLATTEKCFPNLVQRYKVNAKCRACCLRALNIKKSRLALTSEGARRCRCEQ